MTSKTLWCSFACKGNEAIYSVTYQDDGPKIVYLCDKCYPVFIKHGPSANRSLGVE